MTALIRGLGLAAALSGPAIAADGAVPDWCCPESCRVAGRSVVLGADGVSLPGTGRVIPYARNVYLGEARDGRVRICIGFDDFGDREVKCLFAPPAM